MSIIVSYDTESGENVLLKYKKIISSVFIFNGLSQNSINSFIESSDISIIEYTRGENVIGYEDCLAIMLSGEAVVRSDDGDRSCILRKLVCGDVFGAASVFATKGSMSKISARIRSNIAFIPKCCLEKLISSEYIAAKNYIEFLSNRVAFLNTRIAAFTCGDVRKKIASYIKASAKNNLCIPEMSMQKLAESLDVGRASLYRTLEALCNDNIIVRQGKQIIIIDQEKLENIIK